MSFLPKATPTDGFMLVLLAKRRVGKSYMTRYLIQQAYAQGKGWNRIHIFSQTGLLARESEWRNHIDEKLISELNDEKLAQIIEYQRNNTDQTYLIVLDDCLSAESFKNIKHLNMLASEGRHYGISVIISTQYSKGLLAPAVRNNVDFLMFSTNTKTVLDTVYDMVVYHKPKQDFYKMVETNTKDYYFILYNNTGGGKFARIKSKPVPKEFRVVVASRRGSGKSSKSSKSKVASPH